MSNASNRRLGVAFVGLGGAVASTVVAGIELLRQGRADLAGLPLAEYDLKETGLVDYTDIEFAGWDVYPDDLASAVRTHRVLNDRQIDAVDETLSGIRPWAAGSDANFCRNIDGSNVVRANTKATQVGQFMTDLDGFKDGRRLDDVVVINLASTERRVNLSAPALQSVAAFEDGLAANDPAISPAMMYAYAALKAGYAFGNFTPSSAAEAPALLQLARERGLPVAGRDGKTGQTLMKTVLAPALRARNLKVQGWYSTNILGNRDGQALEDPDSLASKLDTKGDVLDSMLGYKVKDHIVQINYYPPRGDEKEAWDNIDVTGFLGYPMQIKVNFLCRDSVLAAPLVIEIARCLDLAKRRSEVGPLEALGLFFKAPLVADGKVPLHAFYAQEAELKAWLAKGPPSPVAPAGKGDRAVPQMASAK